MAMRLVFARLDAMIPGYGMPVRYLNTAELAVGSRLPGALSLSCAVAALGRGGTG
jgi:hypothetical protein